MNKFKRSITVVYPAGAGGEFFSWLLAQQQDFIPVGVALEKNRWSLRLNTTPDFFHRDTSMEEFFKYVGTHEHKITLLRDHMTFDFRDQGLVDSFFNTRYDMWDQGLFVLLYPQTEEAVQYANLQVKQKLTTDNHDPDSLSTVNRDLKKIISIIGNRDHVIVDPYQFFIKDRDNNIANFENQLQRRFGEHVLLDRNTYNYFIDVWISHNAS